jgi:serine/threonine protein kinase/tetratricopeptide (TPR) repeat protein
MSAQLTPNEQPECLRCHESIGADESYSGYCLGCLLLAALPLDQVPEAESNSQFGPYELLVHPDGSFVELGRGSMGITYEALDTNLYSSVALKVIHSETAAREKTRERFLREARAAARMRHPHVANILYYGVREGGQCFYAMELVEGQTLAQRVRREGPLPIKDALEVMSQVASALEATEKSGVVHRDLKPANLMLVHGPGINVKVIDFGLAKIIGNDEPLDQITYDGFIGTPAFASPEQLSGRRIDQRSDYYSVGSTLYYLLTGNPPFEAEGIGELAKRIDCQNSLAELLKDSSLPASVQGLLSSLLSADLNHRPQSGKELAEAVSKCQQAMAKPKPRRVLLTLSIVGATALTSAGLLLWSVAGQNTPEKSIAVLPFENLSSGSDKAYFADGVQDEILTHLAGVADLKVISRDSVKSYRDPVHRPSLSEIGRTLQVNYIVTGSIQRDANRIRASVHIIEARTGRELWAEHYDGEPADVFAIQTQIAEVISRELRAKLSSAEKATIEEVPTRDIAAYELYLHARDLLLNYDEATQGWDPLFSAVRLLEEAASRDPSFALAWLQLSRMHDALYWFNADRSESRRQAAETALQRALSLRPDLGENHLRLASHLLTTSRDYPAIIKELEIARRSLPNSVNLFTILADVELHRGEWHDALQDLERASTLDPRNLSLLITRGNVYQYHRQYEQLQQTFADAAITWASAESIQLQKALAAWQANGETSPLHALLDEPAGPLRAIGRATILKIICALGDRDFAQAEKILAADPKQEFEGGNRKFVCKDYLLGGIKISEGDEAAAKIAYNKARPLQLAYVNKWPDDPNPLMVLAATDAALGRKEDALREGRQAVAMRPTSQDAVEGPTLAADLAGVYLLAGERELAIEQLESLTKVPRALYYGELAKLPEWDALRSEPRFQKLLSDLKPIPIINRLELGKN